MRCLVSWLLFFLAILAVWYVCGRWITPDVFSLPLGACDLTVYEDRHIAAIACPGHDLIRVWPLPVISPWFEEPVEIPSSQAA